MDRLKALILDDEVDMLEVCSDMLRGIASLEVVTESESPRAVELLAREAFDILIVDLRMPDMDGLEVLRKALERQPEIQVIMITGFPTVDTAIDAIKQGASDYIVKPFAPEQLREKVQQAIERRYARSAGLPRGDPSTAHTFDGIVGKSPAMQKIFERIRQVGPTNSDVLILGESGTGKELIARSIHGHRKEKGRFVPVDCGAIPENLLESELFGHEKGAFTGAGAARMGLLEFADGGTFFLDEVCELAPGLQAKLLRALQERSFRRVGGKREIQVSVRVVAATNRDIEKEVEGGRFREDLYYRINVVKIRVPPLRDRREDITLLVDHFVGRFAREAGKALLGIGDEALAIFLEHPWRGNVRELQNVLKHCVTVARGDRIGPADLPEDLRAPAATTDPRDLRRLRSSRLEELEKDYVVDLLRRVGGDVSRAAQIASVSRATFYRLMNKLHINPSSFR